MTIIVSVGDPLAATYGELQSDVADWLARDDLTSQIKKFIRFAESDICKDLRVRGMEKETTFSVTDSPETLPTDFKGARRLYVDVATDSKELDFLSPEVFHRSRVSNMAGNPHSYTIEGENIRFAPLPGASAPVDVKMLYIGDYDELVDLNDTNGLLEKHYNLYLYSALAHGFAYIRDDLQAAKFKGEYDNYVAKLNRNANRERFHGNALRRTGGPSP